MDYQHVTLRPKSRVFKWRLVYWVFMPLSFLLLLEIGARYLALRAWEWYPSSSELAQMKSPIDALFIGNSRVGAAIDAEAFDKQVSTVMGKDHSSVNVGMGFTTMAEHYLALRNMARFDPDIFKGTAVFVAAPDSIPDYDTLSDCWFFKQTPHFLLMHLKAEDLPEFLRSDCTAADKIQLMRLYLFKGSYTLVYREWLHNFFWKKIEQKVGAIAANKPEKTEVDLGTAGGVRNDSIGIALVYNAQLAKLDSVMATPLPGYETSLLAAIDKLVRDRGGRVVLYDLPISTISKKTIEKEVRRDDRARFLAELHEADYVWLRTPSFTYSDVDFPDASHLRASRKKEFSTLLADAWLSTAHNEVSEAGIQHIIKY